MEEIKAINVEAHAYLMERNPKSWCRAYFEIDRCCDAVENGICESFNSTIIVARRKLIITMLEEIHLYAMDQIFKRRLKAQKWDMELCPVIKDKIEELKMLQRFWDIRPSGFHEFEAIYGPHAYAVNINSKTCTCRKWQLMGIPCVHGIGALSYMNHNVNEYVATAFTPNMFLNAYRYGLKPMNGNLMWPTTSYIPPLPPKRRRMPGRPKIKRKRHTSESENRPKITKCLLMSCSNCKARGHNISRCPKKKKEGTSNVNTKKKLKPRRKKIMNDTRDEEPPTLEDMAMARMFDEEPPIIEDMEEMLDDLLVD